VTFLEAVQAPIRKALVFSGRASRKEYWSFSLAWLVVLIVIGATVGHAGPIGQTIYLVAYVAAFVPLLTVSVRRLHDLDRTGFWLLAGFIPFVGSLILLYFMILPSEIGSNTYGPDPNGDTEIAALYPAWVALHDDDDTVPPRPPWPGEGP